MTEMRGITVSVAQESRTHFGFPLLNLLFNAGVLASYLFFCSSYQWYRLLKLISVPMLRLPYSVSSPFQPSRHRVSIQAFLHSSNYFTKALVISHSPDEIHSHAHRVWAIKQAVRRNVRPIILIRRPRQVLVSTLQRNQTGYYERPYILFTATILTTWYLFYRGVIRYNTAVCLVPFDHITSPNRYQATRERILAHTGVALSAAPDFTAVNPSPAPDISFTFSPLIERMIARCDRFYERMLKSASEPPGKPSRAKSGATFQKAADRAGGPARIGAAWRPPA